MFTGLIQGLGRIVAVEARGGETRFRILPLFVLRDIVLGESIAVNGACLTVETASEGVFQVYASGETLSTTSLGALRPNHRVNLERALALGDRLGGHLVSGHVDCLATVVAIAPAGESRVYTLRFPPAFGPQVVAKGSVALDGVSLTVNACGDDFLSVNIIPATQRETTISEWTPGQSVNMETDLIGKYVQRMLAAWVGPAAGKTEAAPSRISEAFLREHGF